uniref:pleckstrin homology domain-containing family A member 5 isoform X8 n=1 Tax=Monopterus albus TaxID=43700 RepID=UPI0009B35992|nr:pleckstrin homology domain-containing family A member 5 isoform X8 [Monopterus albus]
MAADLKPEWLSCLPSSWGYGVTRDGRIFFINEEAKSTTWLHPVTGDAVITGHRKTPDLPTGWEEGYTFEGARCFINSRLLRWVISAFADIYRGHGSKVYGTYSVTSEKNLFDNHPGRSLKCGKFRLFQPNTSVKYNQARDKYLLNITSLTFLCL